MSTIRSLARRLAAPALAIAASLLTPGCGGGGGYYDPFVGTLEVRNDVFSIFGIDTVEVSQPFGPVDAFDVFLAPGERDFIDLLPDLYDVELFWSDGSSDFFSGIAIYDHETTVLLGSN